MIDEEFKNITEYLDEKIIFHQAIKEPINKDLDISIKLSVAYEKLQKENQKYKEVINKINTFFSGHEKIIRKLYFKYNNKYLVSNIREDIKNILKEVE